MIFHEEKRSAQVPRARTEQDARRQNIRALTKKQGMVIVRTIKKNFSVYLLTRVEGDLVSAFLDLPVWVQISNVTLTVRSVDASVTVLVLSV